MLNVRYHGNKNQFLLLLHLWGLVEFFPLEKYWRQIGAHMALTRFMGSFHFSLSLSLSLCNLFTDLLIYFHSFWCVPRSIFHRRKKKNILMYLYPTLFTSNHFFLGKYSSGFSYIFVQCQRTKYPHSMTGPLPCATVSAHSLLLWTYRIIFFLLFLSVTIYFILFLSFS